MTYGQTSQHFDVDEVWERSYKQAVTLEAGRQAEYLLETVGPRISAVGLGLADARQIKAWAKDATDGPREHAVGLRLALLFRIVYAITQTQGAAVAALFLRSSNPQLDDAAPLMLLRQHDPDLVQGRLLAATRAFLEG